MSKYYSAGERLATYADLQTVQGEIQTIQSDMPTKVSDLENDLDYTELSYIDSLPASGEENIIYLLETEDGLIQYVYKNDEWIPLGNENQAIILPKTVYDITRASTSAQIVNALGGQSNIDKLIAGLSQHVPVFVAYSEIIPPDFTPTGEFCPVGLSTYGDSAGNLKIFLTIYIGSLQTREIGLESNINDNYTTWHCLSVSVKTILSTTNTYAYEPTNDYHPATKKYVDDTISTISTMELEVVSTLPVTGDSHTIYLVPKNNYINLQMVYANNYTQLIVVHDGEFNSDFSATALPHYDIGINHKGVKIVVGGLEFSGSQGLGYEGTYTDQHGNTVHGWVYYCDTMETPEFTQIVLNNGGTLAGLPVTAEIAEGLFVDDDPVGLTPHFSASFNYGEDIVNQDVPTNIYKEYIYTNNRWEELGEINNIDIKQYVDEQLTEIRPTEMPEPTSENVGTIVQYVGETNEYYITGHFYEVVEQSNSGIPTYIWQEVSTQGVEVDAEDPSALADLIANLDTEKITTVYVENFGPRGNYDGYVTMRPTSENSVDYSYLDGETTVYGTLSVELDPETGTTDVIYGEETYGAKMPIIYDASDPEQIELLIESAGDRLEYVTNFGPNGDYTGYIRITTTSGSTADYLYETAEGIVTGTVGLTTDPVTGDPVVEYENIETLNKDTSVRQANGWSLLGNDNTWQNNHAVYEDFQWIFDEWKAKYNNQYYVPNFSVDGYHLSYLFEYNNSSGNDYRRYCMYFTKLVNSTNYYYTVYFYTHYNNNTLYDETSNYKVSKSGYSSYAFLTSHQSLSNYLAKNNTTSFTPTGDYNPATKKYVDDKAVELEEAIEESSIQVDTLPEPTSSNVGDIYQYTGPDTQDLDHGHFYQVVENAGSGIPVYSYQDIGITTGVTTAVVPQEITDVTYGAYRRYPGYSDTGLQLLQNNNGQLIWGQTVNSIWIGTQAEYDALPEHFDTMIYFIKEDE